MLNTIVCPSLVHRHGHRRSVGCVVDGSPVRPRPPSTQRSKRTRFSTISPNRSWMKTHVPPRSPKAPLLRGWCRTAPLFDVLRLVHRVMWSRHGTRPSLILSNWPKHLFVEMLSPIDPNRFKFGRLTHRLPPQLSTVNAIAIKTTAAAAAATTKTRLSDGSFCGCP